jgi:RiboL-PSP-HEPN
MTARQEVSRLTQRLNGTFERVSKLGDDLELRADFARYLCVLVSGYLEAAVVECAGWYATRRSAPPVAAYVSRNLEHFANPNAERLLQLVGSFNADWRASVEEFLVDERKEAVDSVVALRNQIAHGESVGVTYVRIKAYYDAVREVVSFVANLFDQ